MSIRRILAPFVLLGGLFLALHLHETTGIEATLNYHLPPQTRLTGASPETLELKLFDHEETLRTTLFVHLKPNKQGLQQTLRMPEGMLSVKGFLTQGTRRQAVVSSLDVRRSGTYEIRLRLQEEDLAKGSPGVTPVEASPAVKDPAQEGRRGSR